MPKLTQKSVDIRKRPSTGQVIVRDDEFKGFGLRMTPGVKAYFVEGRVSGRQMRVTIGRADLLSLEEAKKKARLVLAEMTAGIDPTAAKKSEKASSMTLNELLDIYLKTRELKESTIAAYRRVIRHCLKDWLDKPVVDITRDMVEDRHRQLSNGTSKGTSGKAQANFCFKTLRTLLNFAAEKYQVNGEPLIAVNPVTRLTRTRAWYRIHPRTGVIPEYKMKEWYDAVRNLKQENISDYLVLVLFTGLRRREACNLTWADVDFEARTLRVGRDRAKNHREHVLPLSTFLFALLKRRYDKRTSSDFIFPGRGNRGRVTEFRFALAEVRKNSGCRFMIHDLRRSFLSAAERLEMPYYVLKRLANHKVGSDTLVPYIVVSMERLQAHMERISQHFQRLMGIETQAVEVGSVDDQGLEATSA